LAFNSLVFNLLNLALHGNILSLGFISNLRNVLSHDLNWVVVSHILLLGYLDLNGLSLILGHWSLVLDVFDTGLSGDWGLLNGGWGSHHHGLSNRCNAGGDHGLWHIAYSWLISRLIGRLISC
jgi:hypothetical protein